jgi:hypothetical protein
MIASYLSPSKESAWMLHETSNEIIIAIPWKESISLEGDIFEAD